ncbi:hypothetical protein [Streptomyces sp. NPDC093223]|uniref:hypothetical protein n=1 Tax=Streptomyces sp. NPDC093223 TaxID=3366033 RepID=UPI003814F358
MGHTELRTMYDTYDRSRLDFLLAGVAAEQETAQREDWFAALLTTAQDRPQAVIQHIVANIVLSGFSWTGGNRGAAGLLTYGEGDCRSLAAGAVCMLDALGVAASVGSHPHEFVIVTEGVHLLDGQTGNIDGRWWHFENHHWLRTGFGDCDLLLGGIPLDGSAWRAVALHDTDDGLTWMMVDGVDHPVYVADPSSGYSYTMDPTRALVFSPGAPRQRPSSWCDIL